jgi:4-amino-4-deoxy-L-arabinose transferase-like glycosyltransferase
MRFLIVLIILALLIFKLWPEPTVPPVEETFIAPQIQTLRKAEQIEQQYSEALERTNERIERETDGG